MARYTRAFLPTKTYANAGALLFYGEASAYRDVALSGRLRWEHPWDLTEDYAHL
ncbi:hypothetical protein PtB15_1B993 [Puccinia triticina]|nr:hypothetical protein PtB15_1B993 [Puccinia triticina]